MATQEELINNKKQKYDTLFSGADVKRMMHDNVLWFYSNDILDFFGYKDKAVLEKVKPNRKKYLSELCDSCDSCVPCDKEHDVYINEAGLKQLIIDTILDTNDPLHDYIFESLFPIKSKKSVVEQNYDLLNFLFSLFMFSLDLDENFD